MSDPSRRCGGNVVGGIRAKIDQQVNEDQPERWEFFFLSFSFLVTIPASAHLDSSPDVMVYALAAFPRFHYRHQPSQKQHVLGVVRGDVHDQRFSQQRHAERHGDREQFNGLGDTINRNIRVSPEAGEAPGAGENNGAAFSTRNIVYGSLKRNSNQI